MIGIRTLASVLIFAALLAGQRTSVEEAWQLLAQGKRDEAVRLLKDLVKTKPGDGESHLLLGSILAETGDQAGALVHLRNAARLRPKNAMAHNALGEALRAAGEPGAREAFQRALQLNPEFAQAHENLGSTLLEENKLAQAGVHLDRAIRLLGRGASSAYARYLRAKVFSKQNDPAKAISELKLAVSLLPNFPEAWSDLGQAHKEAGDDAAALDALQRAVELNPEGSVAQMRLGSQYLQLDKVKQAIEHLEEAVRLDPKNQTALNGLQLALRADGQLERAAEVKQQLVQIFRQRDRSSEDALSAVRLNNQGAALEKSGDLRAALEKYSAALALDPTHTGIRVNYAVALLRLGRWKEGIAGLREAVQQEPRNEKYRKALEDALAQAPADAR
jgi:tetratricopeptide (TPR) repeat protein